MPIGKSRRIVIDVEDVALKRHLYSALAAEGRSLKEWFASAAYAYLQRQSGDDMTGAARVAERTSGYRVTSKATRHG